MYNFLLAMMMMASSHSSNADELICESPEDCYPRVFEADGVNFKQIREGQSLPKGLHIRINWQTGYKEAKLASASGDNDGIWDIVAVPEAVIHPTQQLVSGLTLIEASELQNVTNTLISLLGMSSNATGMADGLLDELQDAVRHVDYGAAFAQDTQTIQRLVGFIQKHFVDRNALVQSIALTLGNALSNNPAAQLAVRSLDLPMALWAIVEQHTGDSATASRVLYAFSALMRSNQFEMRRFNKQNGFTRMAEFVLLESTPTALRRKAVVLMGDLLDPQMALDGWSLLPILSSDCVSLWCLASDEWKSLHQDILSDACSP